MKTYDLGCIADAVRAVAPEAVIQIDTFCLFDDDNYREAIRIDSSITVWDYGKYEVDAPGDRAIVRAIMGSLDAQDATGGEGEA